MDNRRGIFLMVAAMLAFALEDMFIKIMAADLGVGQILASLGIMGGTVYGIICKVQGLPLLARALWRGPVLLRNIGEIIGTSGFLLAVTLSNLSTATAIFQATPLTVTLGAALFLGHAVGWRRWLAILMGFFGVMLIIRPGTAHFDPTSLFAVQAVLGLTVRDLATRVCPPEVKTMQMSTYGFLSVVPAGLVLMWLQGRADPVDVTLGGQLIAATFMGALGYYMLVEATRAGDVSVITPFRYSRLLFALAIGFIVFHERPDALTLIGAAVIIGSGVYAFARERQAKQRAARLAAKAPKT